MVLWSHGPRRSREKRKSLYLQCQSAYDHETRQDGYLAWAILSKEWYGLWVASPCEMTWKNNTCHVIKVHRDRPVLSFLTIWENFGSKIFQRNPKCPLKECYQFLFPNNYNKFWTKDETVQPILSFKGTVMQIEKHVFQKYPEYFAFQLFIILP